MKSLTTYCSLFHSIFIGKKWTTSSNYNFLKFMFQIIFLQSTYILCRSTCKPALRLKISNVYKISKRFSWKFSIFFYKTLPYLCKRLVA